MPRNENGSLSPAEHVIGFEPGIFQFVLKAIIHSATLAFRMGRTITANLVFQIEIIRAEGNAGLYF